MDHEGLTADIGERENAGDGALGHQHVAEVVDLLVETDDVRLLEESVLCGQVRQAGKDHGP